MSTTDPQLPDDKDGQYTGDEPARQNPPVETTEDATEGLVEGDSQVVDEAGDPGTRDKVNADEGADAVPEVHLTPPEGTP